MHLHAYQTAMASSTKFQELHSARRKTKLIRRAASNLPPIAERSETTLPKRAATFPLHHLSVLSGVQAAEAQNVAETTNVSTHDTASSAQLPIDPAESKVPGGKSTESRPPLMSAPRQRPLHPSSETQVVATCGTGSSGIPLLQADSASRKVSSSPRPPSSYMHRLFHACDRCDEILPASLDETRIPLLGFYTTDWS